MKELHLSSSRFSFRPYLFISFIGILAYAPVSFMLLSLKNDIIVLEYPINFFISEAIHHGEIPYWFNTWGMGFPLQSNLTWGIYSTPQLLFSSLFSYNIWVLHIEFMFFVLLSGWSMFHLLSSHFKTDKTIAEVIAICYMLSGFMVGSSQWLLYITAAAFVPMMASALLQLLRYPKLFNTAQFAILYAMMFTSVYAAFNIITTYIIAAVTLTWFFKLGNREKRIELIKNLGLAVLFTSLLCAPVLYFTTELLSQINRGNEIEAGSAFFQSNYLHPKALGNLLLPFSSVRASYPNTEGTMLHSYMGLFMLTVLPFALWQCIKKDRSTIAWLFLSIFFLLLSFGHLLPLRSSLNVLPGFAYFRNPAIFRFYFIFFLLIFLAASFKNLSWNSLFDFHQFRRRLISFTLFLLSAICLLIILLYAGSASSLFDASLFDLKVNINKSQTLLISAVIQLALLATVLLLFRTQKTRLIKYVFAADLIINTLICTPYFTVSSYRLNEVAAILQKTNGFPVQHEKVSDAASTYLDENMNVWDNVNVYQKKVSILPSYKGPLVLKNHAGHFEDSSAVGNFSKPLVFAGNDSATVEIVKQTPAHIQAIVTNNSTTTITAMQNFYPGWKAFVNDDPITIIQKDKPGITIAIDAGKHKIDFRYERKAVWLTALLIHVVIISFLLYSAWMLAQRIKARSSSLS